MGRRAVPGAACGQRASQDRTAHAAAGVRTRAGLQSLGRWSSRVALIGAGALLVSSFLVCFVFLSRTSGSDAAAACPPHATFVTIPDIALPPAAAAQTLFAAAGRQSLLGLKFKWLEVDPFDTARGAAGSQAQRSRRPPKSLEEAADDVIAALVTLQEREAIATRSIVGLGIGLGGTLLAMVARKQQLGGLVLLSPVVHPANLVERSLWLPVLATLKMGVWTAAAVSCFLRRWFYDVPRVGCLGAGEGIYIYMCVCMCTLGLMHRRTAAPHSAAMSRTTTRSASPSSFGSRLQRRAHRRWRRLCRKRQR